MATRKCVQMIFIWVLCKQTAQLFYYFFYEQFHFYFFCSRRRWILFHFSLVFGNSLRANVGRRLCLVLNVYVWQLATHEEHFAYEIDWRRAYDKKHTCKSCRNGDGRPVKCLPHFFKIHETPMHVYDFQQCRVGSPDSGLRRFYLFMEFRDSEILRFLSQMTSLVCSQKRRATDYYDKEMNDSEVPCRISRAYGVRTHLKKLSENSFISSNDKIQEWKNQRSPWLRRKYTKFLEKGFFRRRKNNRSIGD